MQLRILGEKMCIITVRERESRLVREKEARRERIFAVSSSALRPASSTSHRGDGEFVESKRKLSRRESSRSRRSSLWRSAASFSEVARRDRSSVSRIDAARAALAASRPTEVARVSAASPRARHFNH